MRACEILFKYENRRFVCVKTLIPSKMLHMRRRKGRSSSEQYELEGGRRGQRTRVWARVRMRLTRADVPVSPYNILIRLTYFIFCLDNEFHFMSSNEPFLAPSPVNNGIRRANKKAKEKGKWIPLRNKPTIIDSHTRTSTCTHISYVRHWNNNFWAAIRTHKQT